MTDYLLDDNPAPIKVDIEKELAEIEGWAKKGVIERHYGPGPHPGTGTEQSVHAGKRGGGGVAKTPEQEALDELTGPRLKREQAASPSVILWEGNKIEIHAEFAQRAGEIIDVMRRVYEKALDREPDLTGMMQELGHLSGGELYGLEFRVKRPDSIARKIQDKMLEMGVDAEKAATQITDLNRYTMIFDQESYVEDVIAVQQALKARGWHQYDDKWKNYFSDGDDYDGYNTVMVNPDSNTVFEVQYHTRETIQRKEESWQLYSDFRRLPPDDPRALSLFERMRAIWSGYQKPAGWERLPGRTMRP